MLKISTDMTKHWPGSLHSTNSYTMVTTAAYVRANVL